MDRGEKAAVVAAMHRMFQDAALVVVTQQSGMTVAQATDLRNRIRDAGAVYKVTKNRLARIALKGTQFEHLDGLFCGPTSVSCGRDPVAAARVVVQFAKTNDKLKITGGALGERSLDEDDIRALAALPSLDQLRASMAGLIATPATRIASVLQAPAAQLARVFSAYASKDEAAA